MIARRDFRTLAVVALTLLAACAADKPLPPRASQADAPSALDPELAAYEHAADGKHIKVYRSAGAASPVEIATAVAVGDAEFERIRATVGAERVTARSVDVVLAGDGLDSSGRMTNYPRTTLAATVFLYRYPGEGGGYESSLGHELVHALRIGLSRRHVRDGQPVDPGFWFLEEGLAAAIANDGRSEKSFPLYGASLDLVAGSLVERGQDVPLLTLMSDHAKLNAECPAQAYPLRASFVAFLRERFGMPRLLSLAYGDAVDAVAYERIFGAALPALTMEWRAWLVARYRAIPQGDAQAKRYRESTPIRFVPLCGQR